MVVGVNFRFLVAEFIAENMNDELFAELCRREWFRAHIQSILRESVRDELFWNRMFEDGRIRRKISDGVRGEVPKQARQFMETRVPGMVSTELVKQLPSFLSQNVQFQEMLRKHSSQLSQDLEESARQTLDRIVNEPEYHEVNKAYFDAFRQKADQAIHRMETDGQSAIAEMEKRTANTLGAVESELRKMKKLEDDVDTLRWMNRVAGSAIIAACAAACGYIVFG